LYASEPRSKVGVPRSPRDIAGIAAVFLVGVLGIVVLVSGVERAGGAAQPAE